MTAENKLKLPPLPKPVTAADMRETLNVAMFEEEAQAAANGFNQCLLEVASLDQSARRMLRSFDECLIEMDAMQENINHKQKTIHMWKARAEAAEKRLSELESKG